MTPKTEKSPPSPPTDPELLARLAALEAIVLRGYEETRRMRQYTAYALSLFIFKRHLFFYLYCGLCIFITGNAVLLSRTVTESRYYLRDLNQFRRDCGEQPLQCFTGKVSPPELPRIIGTGSTSIVTHGAATGSALEASLGTIAWAEGTHDRYDIIFGGSTFTDYSWHPRRDIPLNDGTGRTSDAAGRYQFLSTTWAPLAEDLNLADFSPPNQDKAAIALLKECGGYGAALRGDMAAVANACWNVWASLEGYDGRKLDAKQGSYSPERLQAVFNDLYQPEAN